MQQESPEVSHQPQGTTTLISPQTSLQDGFHQHQHAVTASDQLQHPSRGASHQSTCSSGDPLSRDAFDDGVNADQLDKKLRGLNVEDPCPTPGQRIADYENALSPLTIRQALGFKVIKRANPSSDGPQLADFPNGSWILGGEALVVYETDFMQKF